MANATIKAILNKAKRSFTLVECLVSLAVFSLIVTGAGAMFVSLNNALRSQYFTWQAIENSRWAMNLIVKELRNAVNINTSPGPIPTGRGVRFDLSGQRVWYWRGTAASDSNPYGYSEYIYRGEGNSLNQAYNNRHVLLKDIQDNPINPSSGQPYPLFEDLAGGLVIRLNVGKTNKTLFLQTQVNERN